MDLASVIGLVACGVLVVFGIVFDAKTGVNFSSLLNFLDVPSAIITFGGAFMCIMAGNTMGDFVAGLKSFGVIFKPPQVNPVDTIQKIIDMSNVARKEGLLALEEASHDIEDAFLKKGIMLVVDGTDPELVRGILETELDAMTERHKAKKGFWEGVAAMGPAWGMIGTLIGLVNMLKALDDPNAIGPAMAVALLTTMYGSMLANWICAPVTSKMSVYDGMEAGEKQIMIEGLLFIQAGENPRVIEEKLKSFLAPADRPAGEGGGGE
ncbi:MAG: motility protein A [Lachnospiraceae bacterium]|nr:motility protein A [Lachnospiraceae bacterium]